MIDRPVCTFWLVLLAVVLGGGSLVGAAEPVAAQDSQATVTTQPKDLGKTTDASTHCQCFQQTRFPPRRAKKNQAPSSDSSKVRL